MLILNFLKEMYSMFLRRVNFKYLGKQVFMGKGFVIEIKSQKGKKIFVEDGFFFFQDQGKCFLFVFFFMRKNNEIFFYKLESDKI